jgi:hypothetical protein
VAYIHKCFITPEGVWDEDAGGTEVQLRAAKGSYQPLVVSNGRSYLMQDASGITLTDSLNLITSIYCATCEKVLVNFVQNEFRGERLPVVEAALLHDRFELDGILWVED